MPVSDSNERQRFVATALRHARGQYNVARTSQLSGIPVSTLYEWSRHNAYVADFEKSTPMSWSYRDLVFLRLLAWLRQRGMERRLASGQVERLKSAFSSGLDIQYLYADRHSLFYEDERSDRESGYSILPFDDISALLGVFNLLEPINELGGNRGKLWAPDLQSPSRHTRISPFVLAGDPCIVETRVPTSSIHALRISRGLSVNEIMDLYPILTTESIEDAFQLEQLLRREIPLDLVSV
jgi:uncharacterized protein (DUF433 family)